MTKTQELFKLMQEHPELKVVPVVDTEFTDNDYSSVLGEIGTSRVAKFTIFDNQFFDDIEEVIEYLFDNYAEEYPEDWTNKQIEKDLEQYAKGEGKHILSPITWEEAIIVRIETEA